MTTIEVDEETIRRRDALRIEEESYDEIINEPMGICQASEMTLYQTGDEL